MTDFGFCAVLGMPEVQPSFGQTSAISAEGKWALFAEDLSSGNVEKPSLRTRLLLYDLQAKTWPREFEIDGSAVTALDLSRDGDKAILAGRHIETNGKQKPKETALKASLIVFDLRPAKRFAPSPAPTACSSASRWPRMGRPLSPHHRPSSRNGT